MRYQHFHMDHTKMWYQHFHSHYRTEQLTPHTGEGTPLQFQNAIFSLMYAIVYKQTKVTFMILCWSHQIHHKLNPSTKIIVQQDFWYSNFYRLIVHITISQETMHPNIQEKQETKNRDLEELLGVGLSKLGLDLLHHGLSRRTRRRPARRCGGPKRIHSYTILPPPGNGRSRGG